MGKPKKGNKVRRILFAVEILIMLLCIGGLYVYGQLNQKLEIIEEATPEFEEEKIIVNAEAPKMTGYTTYALFGIDHRDKNAALAGENSDTMMIASINNDTKKVKIVSLYRDTLLDIGNGVYAKANAAYAYGGPEQAISMLNKCLDLDIKDYVTVDFRALVKAIDDMGGLDIGLSYAEMVHMNNYCKETSEETDTPYTPLELPPEPENIEEQLGIYHLNGVQATSYCRIRYTASLDMGRTQRQRTVIWKLIDKAKTAGLKKIFKVMDDVFPLVHTSLNSQQILQLVPIMFGYDLDKGSGFPMNYKFSNVRGSVIVATSLESNVIELHKFLYGDDANYVPSSTVTEISNKILDIVGGADKLDDVQIVKEDEENTKDDDVIFYDPDNVIQEPGTDEPENDNPSTEDPGIISDDPGEEPGGNTGSEEPGGNTGEEEPGGNTGTEEPGGYEEPTYEEPVVDDPGSGGEEEPGFDTGGEGDFEDIGSGEDEAYLSEDEGNTEASETE